MKQYLRRITLDVDEILEMTKSWKPWHEVVQLRDDIRSGELSLAIFAADLYRVTVGDGPGVYRDPREFFALTFPTIKLRQLARDVVLRLAGKSDKAVRQLALTYGGGKTHTLITLYHLTHNPDGLPREIPAVQEFLAEIGMTPPATRIAVLPFDKLDVEKGMEAIGPAGERRWLKHPWSVLAYALDGDSGLELLSAEGRPEERESAPAENLLTELLSRPAKQGLATLVLIDEVLMYAREKVGFDRAWQSKLVNFFQYLTQAAARVDRCAIVASLLATDVSKNDELGKEITRDLHTIFRREREEEVQPVERADVAEVLRRRFFTPESISNPDSFRAHVVAALKGIADLDEVTRKNGSRAEAEFLQSFPFHPELTEVLYGKWTGLEGFQRTRGVLRTFALGLRDAERWDKAPLVSTNVFLSVPGSASLSEAARELTSVASNEEYEGKRHEWSIIVQGELDKARDIQDEVGGLRHREIEQAVFATFLHSQPVHLQAKATTRDLLSLIGATRPDRIELEKGLRRWTEESWYLDEAAMAGGQPASVSNGTAKPLPNAWRLGTRPNLRQMHHAAVEGINGALVEAKLLEEIPRVRALTVGASGAGARVHMLPDRPKDIEEDGEFHYAVLGPKAASDPGRPSAEARRFVDETTGPDRPRVTNRNAIVLAVPSRDGLEIARTRIRDYLGWEEVREQLKKQDVDPIRQATLEANLSEARKGIPTAILQAYNAAVTVSEKNEIVAFKVVPGDALFAALQAEKKTRIEATAINAEALLPEGPYDLWRAGETARRVKDLAGAFAELPHLPKMLNRRAIEDTVVQGNRDGMFVLRTTRPDRSVRTFWRQEIGTEDAGDSALEVVLPEAAELAELAPRLLEPGVLPGLWPTGDALPYTDLAKYFGGGYVAQVPKDGYEEPITIPEASPVVLEAAVRSAVATGRLWITAGPASLWKEDVPAGIIGPSAVLRPAPALAAPTELLPDSLPLAWGDGNTTTALSLASALAQARGIVLPWPLIRDAIDGALRSGYLDLAPGVMGWPAEAVAAKDIMLRVKQISHKPNIETPKLDGALIAEATLKPNELQDLADQIGSVQTAAIGYDLRFHLRIEVGGDKQPPENVVQRLNELLREVSTALTLQ